MQNPRTNRSNKNTFEKDFIRDSRVNKAVVRDLMQV